MNTVFSGGGSLRIYDQEEQKQIFEILGFSEEEIQAKFGFLVDAYKYEDISFLILSIYALVIFNAFASVTDCGLLSKLLPIYSSVVLLLIISDTYSSYSFFLYGYLLIMSSIIFHDSRSIIFTPSNPAAISIFLCCT